MDAESARKATLNAPCGWLEQIKGEMKTLYPHVNCGYNCESCGWNPEERERRRQLGRWSETNIRINPEIGEIVMLANPVRKLVFPKKGGKKRNA